MKCEECSNELTMLSDDGGTFEFCFFCLDKEMAEMTDTIANKFLQWQGSLKGGSQRRLFLPLCGTPDRAARIGKARRVSLANNGTSPGGCLSESVRDGHGKWGNECEDHLESQHRVGIEQRVPCHHEVNHQANEDRGDGENEDREKDCGLDEADDPADRPREKMHIAGQLPEVRLVRTDIHLLIGIPTGEKNWPAAGRTSQ